MAETIFIYEGAEIIVQCDIYEKIEDIIFRFLIKINNIGNDNLIYLYNGKKIDKDLKFKDQANKIDLKRMKIDILVTKIEEEKNSIKEIISKDIICPECKGNIILDFENYKINLKGCKNNHKYDEIILNKFKETQKICLNEIKCSICELKNKGNTYNNEFYICITCDKNICPLCLAKHDKEHKIINYDDRNYICKKHNESFIKYCKKCKEDICIICENSHKNHDILDLSKLLIDKNDLKKNLDNLNNIIKQFKLKINIIIELLNKMNNIIDRYYQINDEIINNYNMNKRNYYSLLNINNIKNKNELLIKELNNIIKEDKVYEYSLCHFYNENGDRYFGELFENMREGKGIYFYKNGDKYEGEWVNDIKEGRGIYFYNNGNKYEGDFKNDIKEGKGIFYWKNGDKYIGDWKNDKKEGKGILITNNNIKYQGDWKNGKKEGRGIYYYNNGSEYEGDFKNDVKEGKGIIIYKDGSKYEGDFKFNKREGKGIFYYNNGKKEEGEWKNNKLVKNGYFNFW